MSSHVIMGFENIAVADLQSALAAEFGVVESPFVFLGCRLEVEDARETYRMADRLLRGQALEESNPFLKRFDILPFATEIQLSCGSGRSMAQALPQLSDVLASTLSARLHCRALVRIADGEVPFRLYRAGEIEQDYRTEYADVFGASAWVPATIG